MSEQAKTVRKKRTYPDDFKTNFGVTFMNVTDIVAASFMSGFFLLYLTDYAGLGTLGASIAPIILVIGRIFDAVNDPLQGYIIDSAKPRKFGRFRFFSLVSILMSTVAIAFLYSIPEGMKTNKALLFIWVLFFYFLYDMGSSFFSQGQLIQTFGNNLAHRSKLMLFTRLIAVFTGVVFSFFMMIVNGVNTQFNNIGKAFSTVTVVVSIIAFVVSVLSLLMVKEGTETVAEQPEKAEAEGIKLTDIVDIFRKNKAFVVHFFGVLFRGFILTLLTATSMYYIKWMYFSDFATGEIDLIGLGTITAMMSIISMLPMLISALISPAWAKKLQSSVKLLNIACTIVFITGVVGFILHVIGVMQVSPYIFVLFMAVMNFGNGLSFVPTGTMWMECMDYNKFVTGKTMGGSIGALSKFLGKAQTAIATLMVGLILTGIGYEVDSVSGNYVGDLTKMPSMMMWFMVVCALLPGLCALITYLINRNYPITDEVKEKMQAATDAEKQQGD